MKSENPAKASATEESKTEAVSKKSSAARRFEKEREQFRALLLVNPNYFGNVKVSPFQPVVNIQLNNFYEDFGCVGYQPQFNRLDAVVFVKQPFGYGGDICSRGTPEYVRFYISYDNGITYDDLGLTSFTAYDIPEGTTEAKRLEYAVSLEFIPRRDFCYRDNLAKVRAILSWNVPPPPNDPDFIPVWGNVHDTNIEIAPRARFPFIDILDDLKIKIPPLLPAVVDLNQPISALVPQPLDVLERKRLYLEKGVEPHRFILPEIKQALAEPALSSSLMASNFKGVFAGLDIDLSQFVDFLFPQDGNTRYEQLECVGLNTEEDTLVGVIRVKLPNGYLGGPCKNGSREYVTFWADFDNNGSFETCLGTTSVLVHDIEKIPREGLEYSVFLPVDFSCQRQPCGEGPRVVRIRAILSWEVPPPCFNPNYIPIWGNREETLVQLRPGRVCQPGVNTPFIETVGSMSVTRINPVSGLANGAATLAGFTAKESPFGGLVIITGHIANAPDISNGAAHLKYRISVRKVGELLWQPVSNNFSIEVTQLLNGIPTDLPISTQSTDANGFYEYQEDLTDGPGNAMLFVKGNVLARWHTSGLTGLWNIRIEAKDQFNNVFVGATVRVRLDNQAPQIPAGSFKITSGGGNCADFTIGDVITGTYEVIDEHFGSLALSVLPAAGGQFTSPAPYPGAGTMPLVREYSPITPPGVPTTGEAGTWSLDTSGMPRCGYVIRLGAHDRTIVNSGSIGHPNAEHIGLCLREPEEE